MFDFTPFTRQVGGTGSSTLNKILFATKTKLIYPEAILIIPEDSILQSIESNVSELFI